MATGHYIRRKGNIKDAHMYRAEDKSKDQSYFLFATTQDQLDYLRFPLGEISKAETRKIAEDLGLIVYDKKDSQDICFIPDGDYKNLLSTKKKKGEILDLSGNVLSFHDGIQNFTVGQRRGLGIANEDPLYVVDIIKDKNQIIVGDKKDLLGKSLLLGDLNFIMPEYDLSKKNCWNSLVVQKLDLYLNQKRENLLSNLLPTLFEFDEPAEAITKGSSLCFVW